MDKSKEQNVKELGTIEKWNEILDLLSSYFKIKSSEDILREDIFAALFLLLSDKYSLEWRGDLWDLEMDYDEALQTVLEFDFNILKKTLFSEQEILPGHLLMKYKVRIKSKGLIWIIHKYDKDPFPSNPHAHQIDNNIKLDLSNGNCYKVREYIYTLKKKDLLSIRIEAEKVFDGELPVLTV
jgi:hypothetical protein